MKDPKTIAQLMEEPPKETPCWISPWALLKGGTAIVAGEAAIGKSFFVLELARAVAAGKPPFGSKTLSCPEPETVLYLEQELTEQGLKRRVDLMFRNHLDAASRIWYVTSDASMRLDTLEGRKSLSELAKKIAPAVIIFDPIGRFHLATEDDASSVQRLFLAMEEIRSSAREDCSLIIVHHVRKPPQNPEEYNPRSPYNMRGSGKWFDVPDTRIILTSVGRSQNRLIIRADWTFRHAPSFSHRLEIRIQEDEISVLEHHSSTSPASSSTPIPG